jgi:hydroxyethylthiazole kinase-like uncharacterized protein yjeF
LQQRGFEVSVFVIGRLTEVKGDARINLEILGRIGQTVVEVADETAWELHGAEITGHDLIIDAMFGTGLTAPLTGFYETVVADINEAGVPIVAIDVPSGMSADTSDLIGHSIEATVTVTLAAPKLPLVLPAAEMKAGEVVIADIGIPSEVIDQLEGPRIELLTRELIRPLIQPRAPTPIRRFRPRARRRRIDGEGGRRSIVRPGRDARRRRAGHRRGAEIVSADDRRAHRRLHDRRSRRDQRRHGAFLRCGRRAWHRRRRHRGRSRPGRGEAVTTFVRELLDKCEGPWCSTRMR